MVKTNKKHAEKFPGKKDGTSHCRMDSPAGDNQHEDCDWVIVKKQRVTILIPAAPLSERSLAVNQEPSHRQLMPPLASSNHNELNHNELPEETSNENLSGNEQKKTVSLADQEDTHTVGRAPPPLLKSPLANPPRVYQRIESDNPHQVIALKSHKLLGVSNTSKAIKEARTLLAPKRYSNLATLNQGLRASNLKRKLKRAGGLSKWLISLGLEQFVRIFQGKILGKYQLANLTMKKLKDMGASAVGPRRKLIHAIDCVCQPYCFEAL